MLADHQPYRRVLGDETTASDRQWLRMLADAFTPVAHEDLVKAGLDPAFVTQFLGLVALNSRKTVSE